MSDGGDNVTIGRKRTRRERSHGPGKTPDDLRGRLRPHDPFELIRWLALSQPDPRKALAELVQNSLDAGARKIRVSRIRERGAACLKIFDDGEGVIPEMERPEALRYIATHIGHSRKRDLSPQERLALMTQGQYGIGLLGFWSLGEMLDMRSVMPGQRAFHLVLYRDKPDFLIQPLRGRLPIEERWTEVVVAGLHREAMGALVGRRAADYLASELRGQLLSRDIELVVADRMSRGTAKKLIPVRPPRFLGERVEGIRTLEVPGHPQARIEVYFAGDSADGAEPRGLAVYCSGTLVAEGFHELAALALDHPPWTDHRLTGFVDFPGFQVAPGSRRGIVPDEAAGTFARAIVALEPVLNGLLASLDRQRSEEIDRTLIRDLQRAFRDFYRHRPRYTMLPVRRETDGSAGPGDGAGGSEGGLDGAAAAGSGEKAMKDRSSEAATRGTPAVDLLPAGPLDAVRLNPSPLRIVCGGSRRASAEAIDAAGRPVEDPVSYEWELHGRVGTLTMDEAGPSVVIINAVDEPAQGSLLALARSGFRQASAEAPVEVVEETSRSSEGIPEPEFVHESAAVWRSRMVEERWQVNTGHRDYRVIADRPALKLRYLAMLFGKEVVLRSSQDPRLEKPLEQLVEVSTYADRNLSERGRRARIRKGSAREAE